MSEQRRAFFPSWSSPFSLPFLGGGARSELERLIRRWMRASSKTILYFLPGTDPGGLLIPWSQMLSFSLSFFIFLDACTGRRWRLLHFSEGIQEWPKPDPDGRTMKQHLSCTSCWHLIIPTLEISQGQKKKQKKTPTERPMRSLMDEPRQKVFYRRLQWSRIQTNPLFQR